MQQSPIGIDGVFRGVDARRGNRRGLKQPPALSLDMDHGSGDQGFPIREMIEHRATGQPGILGDQGVGRGVIAHLCKQPQSRAQDARACAAGLGRFSGSFDFHELGTIRREGSHSLNGE